MGEFEFEQEIGSDAVRIRRNLAANLKSLRENWSNRNSSPVTRQSIAAAIGISQSTISGIESASRDCDAAVLVRISSFFGVSVDSLLGDPSRLRRSLEQGRRDVCVSLRHDVVQHVKAWAVRTAQEIDIYAAAAFSALHERIRSLGDMEADAVIIALSKSLVPPRLGHVEVGGTINDAGDWIHEKTTWTTSRGSPGSIAWDESHQPFYSYSTHIFRNASKAAVETAKANGTSEFRHQTKADGRWWRSVIVYNPALRAFSVKHVDVSGNQFEQLARLAMLEPQAIRMLKVLRAAWAEANSDGEITGHNDAFARMLTGEECELIGRHVREFLTPDSWAVYENQTNGHVGASENGEADHYQLTWIRNDRKQVKTNVFPQREICRGTVVSSVAVIVRPPEFGRAKSGAKLLSSPDGGSTALMTFEEPTQVIVELSRISKGVEFKYVYVDDSTSKVEKGWIRATDVEAVSSA